MREGFSAFLVVTLIATPGHVQACHMSPPINLDQPPSDPLRAVSVGR